MNENERKIYLIEEGLYQGGQRQSYPEEIHVILSLNPVNEAVLIDSDKVAQIWMTIDDGLYPGHKWLEGAVSIVENFRNMDKNVYVHCLAGRSRSVMVVAAYLIKKHCLTVHEALNKIGNINPEIDPNPRFVQGLKDYYNKLYKNG